MAVQSFFNNNSKNDILLDNTQIKNNVEDRFIYFYDDPICVGEEAFSDWWRRIVNIDKYSSNYFNGQFDQCEKIFKESIKKSAASYGVSLNDVLRKCPVKTIPKQDVVRVLEGLYKTCVCIVDNVEKQAKSNTKPTSDGLMFDENIAIKIAAEAGKIAKQYKLDKLEKVSDLKQTDTFYNLGYKSESDLSGLLNYTRNNVLSIINVYKRLEYLSNGNRFIGTLIAGIIGGVTAGAAVGLAGTIGLVFMPFAAVLGIIGSNAYMESKKKRLSLQKILQAYYINFCECANIVIQLYTQIDEGFSKIA